MRRRASPSKECPHPYFLIFAKGHCWHRAPERAECFQRSIPGSSLLHFFAPWAARTGAPVIPISRPPARFGAPAH
jgi:hypothetical protein